MAWVTLQEFTVTCNVIGPTDSAYIFLNYENQT